MALNLRNHFSMEITGIAMYNKTPAELFTVSYIKPEPATFDDVLKLFASSEQNQGTVVDRSRGGSRTAPTTSFTKQMKMYKEDQLLLNPGGDSVFVDAESKVVNRDNEHSGFKERVGKDIKGAKSNFENVLKDIVHGSRFYYKGQDDAIEEGQRVGLVKTIENFFKDLFSGLSLGTYTSGTENRPSGAPETAKHSLKKVFVDAIYKDVVVGVPRGAVQIVKDAALVCLNLAEAVPDATIGNTRAGESMTTKVFDNTQVALTFFTDALPGGEGRGRVYAFRFDEGFRGLPLIHNLTAPEQGTEERDFKYVRNTSFRKTIETISSIIPLGTAL